MLGDPLPGQPVADPHRDQPLVGARAAHGLAVVDLEHGELRILLDEEAHVGDGARHLAELGRDDDVRALVHLGHRGLDDLGVELLEILVIGAVVHAHEPPEDVDGPPAGRARAHEAEAVLIEGKRVPRREAPLDVQVDEREDLRIVQLLGQGRGIGIFADPARELRIGKERRDAPFLPPLLVQHVPLGNRLGEAAQRGLQGLHIVRIVADHQAERAGIDRMLRPGDQMVVGVEEQHVRQLALQKREFPRNVDRRHVLLHRLASQCAREGVAWNVAQRALGRPAPASDLLRHAPALFLLALMMPEKGPCLKPRSGTHRGLKRPPVNGFLSTLAGYLGDLSTGRAPRRRLPVRSKNVR
ncbi:hypothetical protein D516_3455 [Rhodobacter sp. AKP1]|nr:hypothetical protein D516_3455 [Rhodobacter sp. AKP1]